MRIVHTADWHLGKRLCEVSLLDDQSHALDQLVAVCHDERPDALILAGDIYDRAVPPVEAVELFSDFLRRVAGELGVPVVAISGNHDSPERLGFGAELLAGSNVHFVTRPQPEPIVLQRRRREVHIYALPYVLPDPGQGHDGAVRSALAPYRDARRERSGDAAVLVAHLFADGGIETVDSERPIVIGGASRVEAPTLAGWTYVALGHLHRPQPVYGREDIRYAGSLLKYSVAEADHEKGVTLVETILGRAVARPLRLTPRRDLVRIAGSFDQLMHDARFAAAEDAYVEATYTDAGYVVEAAPRLRARFPHLLQAVPQRLAQVLAGGVAPARPPERAGDLLADFWRYVEGDPPPDPGYERAFDEALAAARAALSEEDAFAA
ncbi:MAG TPA: exonuclease SbcCD subunit D [Haliangiales bacterium]|nr:exonuclease SbcCD subunit D [Haliangiales bacterium]